MKNYDKSKRSWYLQYQHVNNLYGWAVSQKFPLNNFEWIEDTSQFNEDFMKTITKIFLKLMFNILKNYMNFIMRMKIEKIEKLVANLHDKTEYVRNLRQEI